MARGRHLPQLLYTQAELVRYKEQTKIELARREQTLHYRTIAIGQISALVIALSFLGCATFLIASGFGVAGTILGTVDLVALAGIFLATTKSGEALPFENRLTVEEV
jgi:uncharacterized membrane protein